MNELSLESGLVPGERIIISLPALIVRSTVESSDEILAGDKKFYFDSDCTRSVQVRFFVFAEFFFSLFYLSVPLSNGLNNIMPTVDFNFVFKKD